MIALLQISSWLWRWQNLENRLIFGKAMDKSIVSRFFLLTLYFMMCVITGYFTLCITERVQFKGKYDRTNAFRSHIAVYITFCKYRQFVIFYSFLSFFIVICMYCLWMLFTTLFNIKHRINYNLVLYKFTVMPVLPARCHFYCRQTASNHWRRDWWT